MSICLLLCYSNVYAIKATWYSDQSNWSPMMIAAYNNDIDLLRFYISTGSNVNEQNLRGFSPLIISARKGNSKATKYLLMHGASPNLHDTSGLTALFYACEQKNAKVVKLLFRFGSNPLYKVRGCTPLRTAVSFSTVRIMKILIKNGVEINARSTIDSMTALGLASYSLYESNKYKRICRFLKKNGAIL